MTEIHPTALVSSQALLDDTVRIGPFAVVEAGAELGPGVVVQAHAVVHGSASLAAGVLVGVHAVVGGDPQDLKFDPRTPTRAEVGAGTVLREGSTVHRSTGNPPTRIGSSCLIMGSAHVAHDCRIGDGVVISQLTAVAGHAEIGDHAVIGGVSGIVQWVRIGRMAMVGAKSKVTRDVLPFTVVDGVPACHQSLNFVGMRRHGHTAADQMTLRRTFQALCRGDAPSAAPPGELARELDAFLRAPSRRGVSAFTEQSRATSTTSTVKAGV